MNKIKIKIDGRVAEIESAPEVVTDNAEYEVEFAVDERDGWNPAVPMTALFVRRDARYTAVVMDAGETICTMPPQTGTNVVYIGLTQEEMRTTTPARIPVRRSVRTMTDFPPLPDKDVYAQILANFAELRMLSGKGAPTTETAGKVNQLYRDETNNRIYVCVNDVDGYTWAMIGGGGGGGTVVTIDTTLTKSGQAADAKAAGDAIGKKLDATALPTAINDALAQAKASGAFDGAKGDKGDTGPKGPKGADGKDGAGMDVTGAKVGQIAKITAVDSAGKPTAWEPVDMPSGGGSGGKQLLYSHNISQDTVLTTDSFDTSGANIDLSVYSHLYIRGMFICNSPAETYGAFYLNGSKIAQIQYFNRKSGQTVGFESDIVCLKTQNELSAGLLYFAWCSEFKLDKFDNIYMENGAAKPRVNGNIQSIGFSTTESSDIFAVKAGSYVEVWGD